MLIPIRNKNIVKDTSETLRDPWITDCRRSRKSCHSDVGAMGCVHVCEHVGVHVYLLSKSSPEKQKRSCQLQNSWRCTLKELQAETPLSYYKVCLDKLKDSEIQCQLRMDTI